MSCRSLHNDKKEKAAPVEYGTVKIGNLQLESGEQLLDAEIAYERAGKNGAPVIVVCHALTGNQETVGTEEQPGWWSGLIGPNSYIDTDQFQVITMNVLGGCSGSTGPTSINPLTNKAYQHDFPFITIRDMVQSQYKALHLLGIDKAKAIIGGSLGGMQVLEWGISYPDFSENLIPLAMTPYLSDYAIAFNTIGRNAIMFDPNWKDGYYSKDDSLKGLEIARMAGLVTYRSNKMFNDRFKREQKTTPCDSRQFQVESYLKYQGEKLAQRFDANSYLRLLHAMDHHDIGYRRLDWKEALRHIKAKVLMIGYSGDLLYPVSMIEEMATVFAQHHNDSAFYEIKTDFGHDGFLVEFYKWGGLIKETIENRNERNEEICQPLTLHY